MKPSSGFLTRIQKYTNSCKKSLIKTSLPLLDGLSKTQKNKSSHDGWFAGRDLNPEPSKHVSRNTNHCILLSSWHIIYSQSSRIFPFFKYILNLRRKFINSFTYVVLVTLLSEPTSYCTTLLIKITHKVNTLHAAAAMHERICSGFFFSIVRNNGHGNSILSVFMLG